MTESGGWAEADNPVRLPNGVDVYPSDVAELVLDRSAGQSANGRAYQSAVVSLVYKPGRGPGLKIEVPPGQDPDAFLHAIFRRLRGE